MHSHQVLFKWILANAAAIEAGVLSSLIVLFLQFAVTLAVQIAQDLLLHRSEVRKLFGFKNPRRIYIVSGSVDQVASDPLHNIRLLAAPDAEAATRIKLTLSLLYTRCEVIHTFSSRLSEEMFSENIVSVGGPIHNSVSRLLLQEMSPTVSFDKLNIITPNAKYGVDRSAVDEVVTDHGLLLTGPNPFESEKRCVVVAGCDTNGVLAAAELLQLGKRRQRLVKLLQKTLSFKIGRNSSVFIVLKTRTFGNLPGDPIPVEAGFITPNQPKVTQSPSSDSA